MIPLQYGMRRQFIEIIVLHLLGGLYLTLWNLHGDLGIGNILARRKLRSCAIDGERCSS